jgi:hypothetical protein
VGPATYPIVRTGLTGLIVRIGPIVRTGPIVLIVPIVLTGLIVRTDLTGRITPIVRIVQRGISATLGMQSLSEGPASSQMAAMKVSGVQFLQA